MKPFRLISNFLAGRKKTLDEKISIESVQYDLTRGDYKKNKIHLKEYNCDHTDCVPWFISKFLRVNFSYAPEDIYIRARHQVYSGRRKENHYFDLEKGRIWKVSDKESICESPFKRATFSYVKDKGGLL